MKSILLSLVVLVVITLSCNQPNYDRPLPYEVLRDDILLGSLNSLCLLDHKPAAELTDNNSFYFARTGPGQLTYSLMLRKKGPVIFGIYHWNNGNLYAYDTLFFHGFEFQMDSLTWNEVTSKCDSLLNKTTDESYGQGMTGGISYVLSHGGNSGAVNRSSIKKEYKEFSEYIIKEIIAPVERLRNRDGEVLLPRED